MQGPRGRRGETANVAVLLAVAVLSAADGDAKAG